MLAAMHLLLAADDSEPQLISELADVFPGIVLRLGQTGLIEADFPILSGQLLPHLAFSRQIWPHAKAIRADSVRAWASELLPHLVSGLPDGQPWRLHVEPHYAVPTVPRMGARAWHTASRVRSRQGPGDGVARGAHDQSAAVVPRTSGADPGRHRCELIRAALIELLQKKRRHLLRQLKKGETGFAAEESLVQVLLTSPEQGWLSLAVAPLPQEQRHCLSPFPKGEVPVASNPLAPSRAFAKLVEAELRCGRAIRAGDRCVDLGAAPGSWTYVATQRGAQVIAVDRSPLREDLMSHPRVAFQAGDAFRFRPPQTVDWLLCDVIAPAARSAELLLEWLRQGWCRQFVVTLKLKDHADAEVVRRLKLSLPTSTREFQLLRLCANKKELCAFGAAGS